MEIFLYCHAARLVDLELEVNIRKLMILHVYVHAHLTGARLLTQATSCNKRMH